jgi:hypothetical protein
MARTSLSVSAGVQGRLDPLVRYGMPFVCQLSRRGQRNGDTAPAGHTSARDLGLTLGMLKSVRQAAPAGGDPFYA